jgi:hypothetical protein
MQQDLPYDQVIVQLIGGSLTITIQKKYANFLDLKKGDTVQLKGESGKYGKYMSLWKKEE